MRLAIIVFLSLFYFTLPGQQNEWNPEEVRKNKVKKVLIYSKVPKTNPAYYGDPKGFWLRHEFLFDREGMLIQSTCKECETKSDPDIADDRVEKYYWRDSKLIRITRSGRYKSELHFYYDSLKSRRLTIGTDHYDERASTSLEYLDKEERVTLRMEIKYGDSWFEGDSVFQVFFTRTTNSFTPTSQFNSWSTLAMVAA